VQIVSSLLHADLLSGAALFASVQNIVPRAARSRYSGIAKAYVAAVRIVEHTASVRETDTQGKTIKDADPVSVKALVHFRLQWASVLIRATGDSGRVLSLRMRQCDVNTSKNGKWLIGRYVQN